MKLFWAVLVTLLQIIILAGTATLYSVFFEATPMPPSMEELALILAFIALVRLNKADLE